MGRRGPEILLFVPNLIGYVRIGLFVLSVHFYDSPQTFTLCYMLNVALDFVDGYAARKLDQCSVFGAWLDVLIDNLTRGFLWSQLSKLGYIIASIEWTVFVCTHTNKGRWKQVFGQAPWIVKKVMENGLHSYCGWLSMSGLFFLPLWSYILTNDTHRTIPTICSIAITAILIVGRILAMIVESYIIAQHILALLEMDENAASVAEGVISSTTPRQKSREI